jgi:hypothetical protein
VCTDVCVDFFPPQTLDLGWNFVFFFLFPPLNVTLVCFALLFGVFHEFAYILKFSLSFFSSVFFWGRGGSYIMGGFCWLRTSSLVGPSPFLYASAPSKARGPALEFSRTVFKGGHVAWGFNVLTGWGRTDGRTNSRRE